MTRKQVGLRCLALGAVVLVAFLVAIAAHALGYARGVVRAAMVAPAHSVCEYRIIWRRGEEDGVQGLRQALIEQTELQLATIRAQLSLCDAETRRFLEQAIRSGEDLLRRLRASDAG